MDFFEGYGHQKYLILELNMRFGTKVPSIR